MTYASGGLIQATDYNNFVASVNAIWGTGTLSYGYGQSTTLSTVTAQSSVVSAAQWSTLLARVNSMRTHQSGAGTGITSPTSGTTISAMTTLASQISTATSSRLSAATVGTTVSAAATNAAAWDTSSDIRATFTWSSANAMRYFFNSGGFITFTGANSAFSGNTKSTTWDALCTACGTIVIRADSSSKSGGSGSPSILNTNLGFYDLTTSYQTILQQASPTAPYTANIAYFQAVLNAAPGSSTSLTVRMYLVDGSTDVLNDTITGTTRLDYAFTPPSATVLSNTWGAVTTSLLTNAQS